MSFNYTLLGDILRQTRMNDKISQPELSKRIKVGRNTISRIENNSIYQPRHSTVMKILKYLNMELGDFEN